MKTLKDFYTRARANEGRRVPLLGPDRKPTEHWLHLLHTDSDAYRETVSQTLQKLTELAAIRDADERKEAQKELQYEAMASLVSAWSFDEPCTRENVIELLREAPYIADYIDRKAAESALFFGGGSGSSSSTPSPAESSNDPKKTGDLCENTSNQSESRPVEHQPV